MMPSDNSIEHNITTFISLFSTFCRPMTLPQAKHIYKETCSAASELTQKIRDSSTIASCLNFADPNALETTQLYLGSQEKCAILIQSFQENPTEFLKNALNPHNRKVLLDILMVIQSSGDAFIESLVETHSQELAVLLVTLSKMKQYLSGFYSSSHSHSSELIQSQETSDTLICDLIFDIGSYNESIQNLAEKMLGDKDFVCSIIKDRILYSTIDRVISALAFYDAFQEKLSHQDSLMLSPNTALAAESLDGVLNQASQVLGWSPEIQSNLSRNLGSFLKIADTALQYSSAIEAGFKAQKESQKTLEQARAGQNVTLSGSAATVLLSRQSDQERRKARSETVSGRSRILPSTSQSARALGFK